MNVLSNWLIGWRLVGMNYYFLTRWRDSSPTKKWLVWRGKIYLEIEMKKAEPNEQLGISILALAGCGNGRNDDTYNNTRTVK